VFGEDTDDSALSGDPQWQQWSHCMALVRVALVVGRLPRPELLEVLRGSGTLMHVMALIQSEVQRPAVASPPLFCPASLIHSHKLIHTSYVVTSISGSGFVSVRLGIVVTATFFFPILGTSHQLQLMSLLPTTDAEPTSPRTNWCSLSTQHHPWHGTTSSPGVIDQSNDGEACSSRRVSRVGSERPSAGYG